MPEEEKTENEEIRDVISAAIDESTNEDENNDTGKKESPEETGSNEKSDKTGAIGSNENDDSGSSDKDGDKEDSKDADDKDGSRQATDSEKQEQVNVPHGTKAPQSWSPKDREDWDKVPSNLQAQINKREKEVMAALSESGEARKQMEGFNRMINPYEGMFAAQGVDAVTGVNNILQMAAALQGGTPQQKAETAAKIIRDFGVDIKSLDSVLVGKRSQSQASPEFQQLSKQMTEMQTYVQNQETAKNYQNNQQKEKESAGVTEFLANNEFANDLKLDMADVMELSDRRGIKISLKEAYDRALLLRPDIQEIISSRSSAASNAENLEKAKKASSSVPQNGSVDDAAKVPDDIRGALLAAMEG